MTGEVGSTAWQLAVDATTAEVVDGFAAAGIRSILLKGAAIAHRLYDDPAERPYVDADLLVEAATLDRAGRVLSGLGFVDELAGARGDERSRSSTPWRRLSPLRGTVDLHVALSWCAQNPAGVWRELAGDTDRLRLPGDRSVEILSEPAQAFVAAGHILYHPGDPKPRADLGRALARFDRSTWERAAAIAARLDCTPSFAAGLGMTDAGRELLPVLGLDATGATPEIRLRANGAVPVTIMLARVAEAPSMRRRATMLARRAVPSRTYMRRWSEKEGHRGLPLPVAYAYRPMVIARRLPAAVVAWRRARRA